MRFKRVQEERSTDKGQTLIMSGHCFFSGMYITWDAVLSNFGNDVAKATSFVQRRRSEPKGTSTCRNTAEETYLFFSSEEREFRRTTIDARQLRSFLDCVYLRTRCVSRWEPTLPRRSASWTRCRAVGTPC